MELGHTPTGDDAFQTAKRLVKETIPKRKKIITDKDIESVISLIARIPSKSVSQDDKENLISLKRDL